MDKNYIKDNRVFPEEMHGSSNTSSSSKENHTASIVWWIVGLLVLLCVVFFVGLWAGKQTTQMVQENENEAAQRERQEVVNNVNATRTITNPEDRKERLRGFFAE